MLFTHPHNYSILMWEACVQILSERISIHPHEWMFGLVVKTHTSSKESWVWISPSTTLKTWLLVGIQLTIEVSYGNVIPCTRVSNLHAIHFACCSGGC